MSKKKIIIVTIILMILITSGFILLKFNYRSNIKKVSSNNKSIVEKIEDTSNNGKEEINEIEIEENKQEEKESSITKNKEQDVNNNKNKTTTTKENKETTSTQKNETTKSSSNEKRFEFYDSIIAGLKPYSSSDECMKKGYEIEDKHLNEVLLYNSEHPDNQIEEDIYYYRCYESENENGKGWFLNIFCKSGNCNQKYQK